MIMLEDLKTELQDVKDEIEILSKRHRVLLGRIGRMSRAIQKVDATMVAPVTVVEPPIHAPLDGIAVERALDRMVVHLERIALAASRMPVKDGQENE